MKDDYDIEFISKKKYIKIMAARGKERQRAREKALGIEKTRWQRIKDWLQID